MLGHKLEDMPCKANLVETNKQQVFQSTALCSSPLLKLTEKMFDVNFAVTKSNKTSSSLKRRE